jgi:hypothetical protein
MSNSYQLANPLKVTYEWHRGPVLHGYLMMNLELQPNPDNSKVEIVMQPGRIWEEVKLKGYRLHKPEALDGLVQLYLPMIILSITEGAEKALARTLDRPVTSVKVIVQYFKVDFMFSTDMAFAFVTEKAIEQSLLEAFPNGLLVTSD